MVNFDQWEGFEGRLWKEEINTRDFIQKNYQPYDGDASFLAGPTEATDKLWGALQKLQQGRESQGWRPGYGYRHRIYALPPHGPGYISEDLKDLEQVVGTADRQASEESIHAFRRHQVWRRRPAARTATSPATDLHKIFTEYRKNSQSGCIRCLHP